MKNTVEGIKSRLDEAVDRISELEDKVEKNSQTKQQNEKRLKKNEEGLRELQDNMKHYNIHIIRIPEGVEKEKRIETLLEKVMTENFPNLEREKVMQDQIVQKVPIKMNPKRPTPRHSILKMAKFKDKERILKAAREKEMVTYKGTPIKLSADFSVETLQARMDGHEMSLVMKSKGLQPRILYPIRFSFKMEGKRRSFTDQKKS